MSKKSNNLKHYRPTLLKFISLLLTILINYIVVGQETKMIIIENSRYFQVTEELGPDVNLLKENVILKHDSAYMYCDSAYFNMKSNSFIAFGNIHVISPTEDLTDTVHLFGDSLHYSGRNKLAEVRYNVVLQKDSMVLYTENLDYKMDENIGYYFDGGKTLNGEDTLVSKKGYYYADLDELNFKDSVVVHNPKYTMYSDTLKHHTKNKISYILGPTDIVASDSSNFIYSESGWYNHNLDIGQLNKNPVLTHKKQTLVGDSIFYDRKKGLGIAFENVTIADSVQNVRLKGNSGRYYEFTESSVITDSALFIHIQKEDSLFMHADTIRSIIDTLITKADTSTFRLIKAYNKSKVFRSDYQAKSDSLIYTFLDSTIKLYIEPILWSGKNQLTADYIEIQTDSNEVNKVILINNSLMASKSDTNSFNQIKGKKMTGHLKKNELYRIDVQEESGAIYFMLDKEKLVGINKTKCKNMVIYLVNNEMEDIWFYDNPEGTMYPPKDIGADERIFKNFKWQKKFRPEKWQDVFIWEKNEENSKQKEKNTGNGKEIELIK
jgi:lipopolysaccharide export system protein LptA